VVKVSDRLKPKDVAVLMINLKTREVELYEPDPVSGFTPIGSPMRYAKVSPFGSIVDAALKMAVNHHNESVEA
jgi:hypothetical protein